VNSLTLEGLYVFTAPQQIVETLDDTRVLARTNSTLAGVDQRIQIHLVDRHRLGRERLGDLIVVVVDLLQRKRG
jgi:hypothetical protein